MEPESEDGSSSEGAGETADGGKSQKINSPAIVLFASSKGLDILRNADEILVDGTFDTAPTPFNQILFLHGKKKGSRAITAVFRLLSRKVSLLLIFPRCSFV